MSAPQVPRPRRRLTQAEFEREAARARGETPTAKDVQADAIRAVTRPLRTRTGRRRSWWQRGWKR